MVVLTTFRDTAALIIEAAQYEDLAMLILSNLDSRMRCIWCRACETPLWRKGPEGRKNLCNACGARYMRSQKKISRLSKGKLSLKQLT
jgi:hypothetical protein